MHLIDFQKLCNILNLIKSYYEVLSSGHDLQLVLVGKRGIGWNEAEEFIKKYNLDDRVIVTGYAKEWEKNILLKNVYLNVDSIIQS